MLIANLALSAFMVLLTSTVHLVGLAALIAFFRRRIIAQNDTLSLARQMIAILAVVMTLFVLHGIEIWLYAGVYLLVGAFDALEPALYFATSTFTTVGFGEIVLDEDWRLFSAIQSANGFLLIGWSTAYLVTVIAMIRDLDRSFAAREE